MRESVEFIELTSLKKTGKDHWEFEVKYNASFERIIASLLKAHVFDVSEHFHSSVDCSYQVNDEGIWLLSHVFSNWDEMYAEATKKSPWEEAWQKRAEQGEPEPEKKQESYTLYRCSGCGKKKKQDPNKSGSPFWECPTCHEYFCEACCMTHRHTYERSYSARTEYGMPGSINIEDIERLMNKMKGGYSWYESQKAKEEEAARQHAKEQEEFQREQARWSEDFWGNFFGAGQQSYSRANGDGSYTHTFTAGVSNDLEAAFNVLGLSTRATVQEVKRAFRRKAKEAHPDTGGSEQAFKALNAAYQLALSHAERNEVK